MKASLKLLQDGSSSDTQLLVKTKQQVSDLEGELLVAQTRLEEMQHELGAAHEAVQVKNNDLVQLQSAHEASCRAASDRHKALCAESINVARAVQAELDARFLGYEHEQKAAALKLVEV